MSTTRVNRLVARFRKLELGRAKLDIDELVLVADLAKLSPVEFADYVEKTDAIIRALGEVWDETYQRHLGASTTRQRLSAAANGAGLDRRV